MVISRVRLSTSEEWFWRPDILVGFWLGWPLEISRPEVALASS